MDVFYQPTTTFCPKCNQLVPGKLKIKDKQVFLQKICPKHGVEEVLYEEDASLFVNQKNYIKPGTSSTIQTKTKKGCPYDCGLCPQHEQHTCIGLIEVNQNCNLNCPTCYASSADDKSCLDLKTIEKMMDFYKKAENGKAELLQISGGEPTIHPQIIDIIKLARKKKFKYLMLNTNGLRLATDLDFVKELSQFVGGFEIYLQFDGFDDKIYKHLRGRPLIKTKLKAIENLTKYKIPITLVTTVKQGVNDQEVGKIFKFGLDTNGIRGVNFQPVAFFGRLSSLDFPRVTATGIINRLVSQTNKILLSSDFLPLPCHPERVAFTYLYRDKENFIPITRGLNTSKYVPLIQNTFTFKPEDFLSSFLKNLDLLSCSCCDLLPKMSKMLPIKYLLNTTKNRTKYVSENIFRVSITSFVDKYNFEIQSLQKECVHIITPNLKRIPFSSYNMFYRQ